MQAPDRASMALVDPARVRPVQVIAVASGKGGVGKTNLSVNLAVASCKRGRQVMLLDADLGLANADVVLGLQPRFNLSHLLDGSRALEDIVVEGPAGLRIVPGSSGIASMANLTPAQQAGLIRAFSELRLPLDVLVIDTSAGVSHSVTNFIRAAQDVLVVVCDEPASITDAYALIKVLTRERSVPNLHVVANMVQDEAQGERLYRKLAQVCERFLDVTVRYLGAVPDDKMLRRAVQRQTAVVVAYPDSRAARAFDQLAAAAQRWPQPSRAQGHLEFFVERLLQPAPATVPHPSVSAHEGSAR